MQPYSLSLAGVLLSCLAIPSRVNADDARDYLDRGKTSLNEGEYGKAIEDFTQAVQLNRKSAKAYNLRAFSYSAMASAELRKAVELDYTLRESLRRRPTSTQEREKIKEFARAKKAEIASRREKANELCRKSYDGYPLRAWY